jgi:hypothetical protein
VKRSDRIRFHQFARVYREQLALAVEKYPNEYPWYRGTVVHANDGIHTIPAKSVECVANKMLDAIALGTYNKDSRAIKATCKILGIAHTYAAINRYNDGM